MHPVLILTHNNLEFTKRAVHSVFEQRINAYPWIVDNGSTDGTKQWAKNLGILLNSSLHNEGVSAGWNVGLSELFGGPDNFEHVLVIGNDTVIPEWFYAELLSYDVPFVTGVAVDKMPSNKPPQRMPLTENPDFSAFLIKRKLWEALNTGFDERFVLYAQDCDMHVRAHRIGLALWKANAPFFHDRSTTLNRADLQERRVLQAQADADRGRFRAMYGVGPGEPGYEKLFEEEKHD